MSILNSVISILVSNSIKISNEVGPGQITGVRRSVAISCRLSSLCLHLFRTDFFLTMTSKEDKMGFPPGVPIKLTVGVSTVISHQ